MQKGQFFKDPLVIIKNKAEKKKNQLNSPTTEKFQNSKKWLHCSYYKETLRFK